MATKSQITNNIDSRIRQKTDARSIKKEDVAGTLDEINEGALHSEENLADVADPAEALLNIVPDVTGNDGKVLGVNGSDVDWVDQQDPVMTEELVVTGVGTLGGYQDGDIIAVDTPIEDVISRILRVRTFPTYTAPTTSLNNVAQTVETGSNLGLSLVLSFVQNNAGAANLFTILRNGSSLSTQSGGSSFSYGYTDNAVPNGNTTYGGTVSYLDGPILLDSFGDPYPTGRILAGTVTATTRIVTGIYPWFYGISDTLPTPSSIAAILAGSSKQVAASTGTITANFGATIKYLWFATPATSTTKTKWFVSETDYGFIGNPGDLFSAPVLQNFTSPSGFWSNISYKVYISTYATNNTSMELRNT